MSREIQIVGGVGPIEAAAIMAAIQQLLDEEAAAQAMLTPRNIPTAWIRSGQRRTVKPARHTTTGLSSHGITDGQID